MARGLLGGNETPIHCHEDTAFIARPQSAECKAQVEVCVRVFQRLRKEGAWIGGSWSATVRNSSVVFSPVTTTRFELGNALARKRAVWMSESVPWVTIIFPQSGCSAMASSSFCLQEQGLNLFSLSLKLSSLHMNSISTRFDAPMRVVDILGVFATDADLSPFLRVKPSSSKDLAGRRLSNLESVASNRSRVRLVNRASIIRRDAVII